MSVHPAWYVLLGLFAIGSMGTALGSRGKSVEIRRQRWLKTLSYAVIVMMLLWLAIHGGVPLICAGCLIVAGGVIELCKITDDSVKQSRADRGYRRTAIAIYAVLSAGFLYFLWTSKGDQVVLVFLVVFCFDSFSQITGQMFGRRPLAPKISPNKTVEGSLGGLAAALFVAWILSQWSHVPFWAAKGTLIAFSSLLGDLGASHYKRRHGVKDFSNWIPYHGGFLDRFDSLIAAGAMCGLMNLLRW